MDKTSTLYLMEGKVNYPNSWITLHDVDGQDTECPYAGVVEVKNGHLYDAPAFIFPTKIKIGRDYTEELRESVLRACKTSYPGFDHILEMEPCYACFNSIDWNNYFDVLRVAEIINKLPLVNLFSLPVLGDPDFNGYYDPEKDIVIERNLFSDEDYLMF